MALELGPHQRHNPAGVTEAVGSTVQRNKALAGLDEVEQGFLLLGGDGVDVGVENKAGVGGKELGIKRLDLVGIGDVDAVGRENGLELAEALGRPVMAVVAQEEKLDARRFLGWKQADR